MEILYVTIVVAVLAVFASLSFALAHGSRRRIWHVCEMEPNGENFYIRARTWEDAREKAWSILGHLHGVVVVEKRGRL